MAHVDQIAVRTRMRHTEAQNRRAASAAPASVAASRDIRLSIADSLGALEPEWRWFEAHADCTVFQSFDWLSTWQRCIGAQMGVRPAIVLGRRPSGELLFIMPLAFEPARFVRQLVFLGRDLCDYNAPLLAPDFGSFVDASRFAALWREVRTQLQADPRYRHDVVLLDKLPEHVGDQPNPFVRLAVTPNPSGAYLTALTDDWESFYAAKRSSSTRRRDRTKRKKLGESGDVAMVTPETPADVLSSLDILIAQKRRAFGRMGVADIFARPGWSEFFAQLAARSRGLVHVSRLDVGSVPAASNLGLTFRGRYYHILASYDEGPLSRFGPGAAHLQDLMRYAIGRRCTHFDFTIGDESYKRDWCDTELKLYDHIDSATARGWMVANAVGGLRRAKRAIKQSRLWPTLTRLRAKFAGSKTTAADESEGGRTDG